MSRPRRRHRGNVTKRSRLDWTVLDDAAPRGVIKLSELVELGVRPGTVASRCEQYGPWQRLLPGVVLLNNGAPSWEQRVDGAVRYCSKPARVTGLAGAQLHGLMRMPTPAQVHVLIHDIYQRLSHTFVLVERTCRLPAITWIDGFPTAPLARCVLDAARRMRDLNQIRALLAEAVQQFRATPKKLLTELDAGSCRGSALPRLVLRELIDGVRSPAESWARELAALSGFGSMWWNTVLTLPNGSHLATPDGWLDEVGLAWEIDSYEFHLRPQDYAATLKRHNQMTASGIVVVHTVPSRLRTEPDQVIAELRGAYELARQRPRPPVIAHKV